VVTAGKMRSFPNASASLALPQNQAGAVNLLHASAWTPKTGETLDDKAVADSDSVLVIQLTNLSNTGLVFGNEAKKLVTKTGALPLLVYKGSATVGLASRRPYKVTAINCDGVPCGPVEGSCKDGVFRFKAETSLFPGGVMACHLTR